MKIIITVLLSLIACACYSTGSNLDFELVKNKIPVGWELGDSEKVTLDSLTKQQGEHAILIASSGEISSSQHFVMSIPAIYQGKKITFSGYIKTKDVQDGFAGLIISIDPGIAFDDMAKQQLVGTNDWKRYSITLDLNADKATNVFFGGRMNGNGKAWFDNLQLTIDGVDIAMAPLKPVAAAKKDHEFDDGSGIAISTLDKPTRENLALLGRVWGFLKYHHPSIAAGKHNWDYELFRILPKILAARNNSDRDKHLLAWIHNLGTVPLCKTCKSSASDAILKPSLAWVETFGLSSTLKEKLQYLYTNRTQGDQYYVAIDDAGSPQFFNEESYESLSDLDTGFRLLALYRTWNIVHYFFPSKHLTNNDWDSLLKIYLGDFVLAKSKLEYEKSVVRLIAEINDAHATPYKVFAFQDWLGMNFPPVEVGIVENNLVVLNYYDESLRAENDLQIGDIITSINGITVDVSDLAKRKSQWHAASNRLTLLKGLAEDLLRSNSNQRVELGIKRSDKRFKYTVKLHDYDDIDFSKWRNPSKDNKSTNLLAGNIGYIDLSLASQPEINKAMIDFMTTKGMIIDLRGFPRTVDWYSLGSLFVTQKTPFAKFTGVNINNPGEVTFTESDFIPAGDENYQGKVIVMVNENSLSRPEYYAMALRAGDNVTIIGRVTAGADGNVSSVTLPGGIMTQLSGIGVYYPDGTQTQRVGIIPDIQVIRTIKGVRAGRDETLDKAIELLK